MATFAGQARMIGLALVLVVVVLLVMLLLSPVLAILGNPLVLLVGAVLAVVAARTIERAWTSRG